MARESHPTHRPLRLGISLPLLATLLIFSRPASAYTDPGSGAFLWQMLIGAGFVALFYIRKLGRWLTGKKNRS